MKTVNHVSDVCVIGGGLSGMCAAISCARHGVNTIIIQDRPVFGGNCSSEIRMWPLGAHKSNRRETGIFEEIVLENMRRNPTRNYPVWDSVLFEIVKKQENLTSIMNCSVCDAETENGTIKSVTGWQLTTYQKHIVEAKIFIDCSGDSILSDLTGAEYRMGREGKDEFSEEAAPDTTDSGTMGNSCLIQARETGRKIDFIAPDFARKLTEGDLKARDHIPSHMRGNYWWIELGGDRNTIDDAEEIRDDLLALSYGVWDHVKNGGDHGADNWELDFMGQLPGKRESRRYIGKHILAMPEVVAGGKFDDIIAYGGWAIDNHPPKGFEHDGEPTKYYDCPSPFGIPYGCLYSNNIENLMFAGRNISSTHCAMASARVMATCAILGQAAGTAASVAIEHETTPDGAKEYIREIQSRLMDDDCWLPGLNREISLVCKEAKLESECEIENIENLRNGIDRPIEIDGVMTDMGCYIPLGSGVTYHLGKNEYVNEVRLVFDSDLDRATVKGGMPEVRDCPTLSSRINDMPPFEFPTTMTDSYDIIVDGEVIKSVRGNRQRLNRIKIDRMCSSIELRIISTTGDNTSHVFSFDFS